MKVVVFSATWCGPCREMKKTIEKVFNQARFKQVESEIVDIDKASPARRRLMDHHGVQAIPALFFVTSKGEHLLGGPAEGYMTQKELRVLMEEAIAKEKEYVPPVKKKPAKVEKKPAATAKTTAKAKAKPAKAPAKPAKAKTRPAKAPTELAKAKTKPAKAPTKLAKAKTRPRAKAS